MPLGEVLAVRAVLVEIVAAVAGEVLVLGEPRVEIQRATEGDLLRCRRVRLAVCAIRKDRKERKLCRIDLDAARIRPLSNAADAATSATHAAIAGATIFFMLVSPVCRADVAHSRFDLERA